jgi:hypothetical protein
VLEREVGLGFGWLVGKRKEERGDEAREEWRRGRTEEVGKRRRRGQIERAR